MNVLIFAPYSINTPHFETELEIAQKHLDDGDSVFILGCNGGLSGCDANRNSDHRKCHRCICRRQNGLSLLEENGNLSQLPPISGFIPNQKLVTEFESLRELKAYNFDSFDIGMAVASSLISWTTDPDCDVQHHGDWLRNAIRSSATAYVTLKHSIANNQIDYLYVHNGRLAILRAAVRAAESAGIDYATVEVGCDNDHYSLCENNLPHNTRAKKQKMKACWDNANNRTREQIARTFFEDRANKKPHWRENYRKQMEHGLLPENWSTTSSIPIFISSEDEFAAISDLHRNRVYPNGGQREALRLIFDDQRPVAKGLHFFVRMHPNLRGKESTNFVKDILEIVSSHPHVTLIPPDSPIDSYALIRHSKKIISFGSTVGVEAVFWGTPSIIGTSSFFFPDEVGYVCRNHNDLMDKTLSTQLTPTNITPALVYGHYAKTFGTKFKHYHSETLFEGSFKGVKISDQDHSLYGRIIGTYRNALQAGKNFRKLLNI